jgi:hypothetical protein
VWVAEGCRGEFEVSRAEIAPPSGGPSAVTRLTCGAVGSDRRQCGIPPGSTARLVLQRSEAPCRLNRTYGIESSHIWVSNGCRGTFEVTAAGAPAGGPGLPDRPGLTDRVTCESSGGERAECRIRSGGRVQLVRQISTAPCIRNSTWGSEYGVLWVTKGCRGEFEVR